ncbi:MAG: hypothetical protein AAF442_04160 [Pseudomonadota bacterium]
MSSAKSSALDDTIAAALLEAKGNKTKAAQLLAQRCKQDHNLLAQLALPVMPAIVQAHLNLSIADLRKKTKTPPTIDDAQLNALSKKLGDVIGNVGPSHQGLEGIIEPETPPQAGESHITALQKMIQSYKRR